MYKSIKLQLEPTSLSKTLQKMTNCMILKSSLKIILMKFYNSVTL
nr:MAG TPA: hypothetical protein [Caudoviricetes sp.]